MWDVWELSQIPTPPHKVIHADEAGWSAEDKFAFDRMILSFGGRWVASKRNETIWGYPDKPPADGQARMPKYGTLAEIFAEYDETSGVTKFRSIEDIAGIDIDAVMESAFGDEVLF